MFFFCVITFFIYKKKFNINKKLINSKFNAKKLYILIIKFKLKKIYFLLLDLLRGNIKIIFFFNLNFIIIFFIIFGINKKIITT